MKKSMFTEGQLNVCMLCVPVNQFLQILNFRERKTAKIIVDILLVFIDYRLISTGLSR